MKEHKIFKPEIIFQDFIKSCWSQNIRTIENKIPINLFLKERGAFALDIDPDPKEEIYIFGLPVNKNWERGSFNDSAYISFEIYSEDSISIDLIFQTSDSSNSLPTKITIDKNSTDLWKTFRVPVLNPSDVRLILFSGSSSNTPNYAIRNIVIEDN